MYSNLSVTLPAAFQSRQAQLESGVRGNVPAPFGAGESCKALPIAPRLDAWFLTADLEDDACAGDLHERTVIRTDKMRVAAVVAHGAVIDYVGAPVRAEPDVRRPVEPGGVIGADKRLVARVVAGEPLDLQRERFVALLVKVYQLDLMADLGSRGGGVRGREPEIPLQDVQGCPLFDRPTEKRLWGEVDPGERRVRPLDRQRRGDLLRRKRQHIADWNIFCQHGWYACRKRGVGRGLTEIIARPTERIEHRLARRQKAEPIRPSVIIRGAVGVLARHMQRVGSAVGGARASFIRAVLADEIGR